MQGGASHAGELDYLLGRMRRLLSRLRRVLGNVRGMLDLGGGLRRRVRRALLRFDGVGARDGGLHRDALRQARGGVRGLELHLGLMLGVGRRLSLLLDTARECTFARRPLTHRLRVLALELALVLDTARLEQAPLLLERRAERRAAPRRLAPRLDARRLRQARRGAQHGARDRHARARLLLLGVGRRHRERGAHLGALRLRL